MSAALIATPEESLELNTAAAAFLDICIAQAARQAVRLRETAPGYSADDEATTAIASAVNSIIATSLGRDVKPEATIAGIGGGLGMALGQAPPFMAMMLARHFQATYNSAFATARAAFVEQPTAPVQ